MFDGEIRHPFNCLFLRTTWVSQYWKGKTILDFNEARDDRIGSDISWTICKSFVPCSRQIAIPALHITQFFTGRMLFM